VTNLTFENFLEQLRAAVLGFDRVYDEHVADHGEVLSHVLLGDLVRFLSAEVEVGGGENDVLKQAMSLLERGMRSQDPRVQELVAVSFLENLDPRDPSFPAIRSLFGPSLEEQYKKYEEATAKGW
jgi:hypothetical protein